MPADRPAPPGSRELGGTDGRGRRGTARLGPGRPRAPCRRRRCARLRATDGDSGRRGVPHRAGDAGRRVGGTRRHPGRLRLGLARAAAPARPRGVRRLAAAPPRQCLPGPVADPQARPRDPAGRHRGPRGAGSRPIGATRRHRHARARLRTPRRRQAGSPGAAPSRWRIGRRDRAREALQRALVAEGEDRR
jgi:hypothetical protein